jgi:hypothetical protein
MKRFAKYALLTLAATSVGFPLGFWYAQHSMGDGAAIFSQTLALSQYETLADLQYKQADPAHGTQAQLDLVNFMNLLEARQKIALPREFDYDRGRALMRLALLAEQAGNDPAFQKYLHDAQDSLDDADKKWYSEKAMRTFVTVADARSKY